LQPATLSHFIQKWTDNLHSTDRLMIAFWGILAAFSVALGSRILLWPLIIATDLIAVLLICSLAYYSNLTGSRLLCRAHDWAAFPLVLFSYEQLYFIIAPLHQGKDYDQLLIAIDHWLVRTNPTEWLARFSNPFLTEVLQISYSLFYVFFIAVGLELYLKKDLSEFRIFRFTIVYGFFLSYLAYLLFPAVGPRFTLHDFSKIEVELPGLFLTPALRWFVNFFESIHPGMSNSLAIASAQRDVFPSGHTMMTLMVIFLSRRYKLKVRHYILVVGILLIIATVYLRYHYLVDLLAGALLALTCMATSKKLFEYFRRSRIQSGSRLQHSKN
jgi:membrane-associated phospholipid phosphatase